MANWEIKNLFQLPSGQYIPCGLNLWQKIWWRFVPGVVINVRWPTGKITVDEDHPLWDWTIGPSRYMVESSDPNDHYRPTMEQLVGKQGRHWQWGVADNDVAANRLTIKIVKSRARYATMLAIKWS